VSVGFSDVAAGGALRVEAGFAMTGAACTSAVCNGAVGIGAVGIGNGGAVTGLAGSAICVRAGDICGCCTGACAGTAFRTSSCGAGTGAVMLLSIGVTSDLTGAGGSVGALLNSSGTDPSTDVFVSCGVSVTAAAACTLLTAGGFAAPPGAEDATVASGASTGVDLG
jgi:hypothetical protein